MSNCGTTISGATFVRRDTSLVIVYASRRQFGLGAKLRPSAPHEMNAGFEAAIWDDVDISTFSGNVIVPRGIYMVTIMHNERGRRDGAQLSRIDVEGEQPIRLTETQYELLDGTPYFERR